MEEQFLTVTFSSFRNCDGFSVAQCQTVKVTPIVLDGVNCGERFTYIGEEWHEVRKGRAVVAKFCQATGAERLHAMELAGFRTH